MTLPARYRVEHTLPGRVFAHDEEAQRAVVIKELTLGRIGDWKELELFEREVKTLRQLSHPSIPAFLADFRGSTDDPSYYLVCERVDGSPLRDLADDLDERRLTIIARHVLEVLVYLQSFTPPIIHRNLTPDALLIDEYDQVRVIDFGAVQVELEATLGGSTVVGTTGYMSPEQLLGRAVPASDLYALGAVFVEVLTGIEPADLPIERMKLRWRELARFGDSSLHDWVDRLVEPDPASRFETAADALRALGEQDIDGSAMILSGRPKGTAVELSRTARRIEVHVPRAGFRPRRRIGILVGAAVVMLVALVSSTVFAGIVALALAGVWLGLGLKDVALAKDSSLVLDVDRGYRLRSPDGEFVAGPFDEVVGIETGFRGERDALWLQTGEEMRMIGEGLNTAEREWLRDELTAFVRGGGS